MTRSIRIFASNRTLDPAYIVLDPDQYRVSMSEAGELTLESLALLVPEAQCCRWLVESVR